MPETPFRVWHHTVGHGGASGRYDRLRERAYQIAWMLRETGLAK